MSSGQNVITVIDVEDRRCSLRVECVGDHFGYPFSDIYALALLCEAFEGRTYDRPPNGWETSFVEVIGPLQHEVHRATNRLGDQWSEVIDDLMCARPSPAIAGQLAARFARAVGYRDFVGVPLPPGLSAGADGLVRPAAWWSSDEERRRVAPTIQKQYELVRETTPEAMVAATLIVEVTDTRWLAHLRPAMNWDCYAFADDSAWIPFHDLGKGSSQLW